MRWSIMIRNACPRYGTWWWGSRYWTFSREGWLPSSAMLILRSWVAIQLVFKHGSLENTVPETECKIFGVATEKELFVAGLYKPKKKKSCSHINILSQNTIAVPSLGIVLRKSNFNITNLYSLEQPYTSCVLISWQCGYLRASTYKWTYKAWT